MSDARQEGLDLAEDLAAHLRTGRERMLTFTQCGLPVGIADVFAIQPWGERLDTRVYEVKTSRQDYWAGVNRGQFEKYATFARRVYVATPQGLVRKDEVPTGMGLITRGANGWRVVKPPLPQPVPTPDWQFAIGLLYRGFDVHREQRRLKDRVVADDNYRMGAFVRNLGHEISARLARGEGEAVSPVERNRRSSADRLLAAVLTMAQDAGIPHEHSWDKGPLDERAVVRLAQFAVAVMKHMALVRELSGVLSRLPLSLQMEVDAF